MVGYEPRARGRGGELDAQSPVAVTGDERRCRLVKRSACVAYL